jgi:hypothetical protein
MANIGVLSSVGRWVPFRRKLAVCALAGFGRATLVSCQTFMWLSVKRKLHYLVRSGAISLRRGNENLLPRLRLKWLAQYSWLQARQGAQGGARDQGDGNDHETSYQYFAGHY